MDEILFCAPAKVAAVDAVLYETVREIVHSVLEDRHATPILVRRDGRRVALVHGLHRREACKALGEESIFGYLCPSPKR
ncbi:MAG: ParB N-terminal domain-containing protein [Bradyrhizobiaceae bacterium]|nr:ParB N-terminal domain-containing protein [Bradyrhizobiaceae bacterium]